MQETLLSSPPDPPAGTGTGTATTRHSRPGEQALAVAAHRAAGVRSGAGHRGQQVPEHATAASWFIVAPARAGGLACVQALPFQRSATGAESSPESPMLPTAAHQRALRQLAP